MRQRLDHVLVARGLAKSRSRARDLILRGAVRILGTICEKPGQLVEADVPLDVDETANRFVARSGEKLAAALMDFGLSPQGRVCLDVGASTGGFTQALVEGGAARVYAVDVGRDQLDAALRQDARVVSLEGLDIRRATVEDIAEPASAIVVDVSFISLRQVLPPALAFAAPAAWLVALIKPQFEAGREAVGKRGVVRDIAAVDAANAAIARQIGELGWRVLGSRPSPLPGKKGNEEWLIAAVREPTA